MNNIDLLFEKNKRNTGRIVSYRIDIAGRKCIIQFEGEVIAGEVIVEIINILNFINSQIIYYKYDIVFQFGTARFSDKLIMVLFECICELLITNYKRDVQIDHNPKTNIVTEGVESSPLLLLRSDKYTSRQQYDEKFHMDIYHYHYRKVVSNLNGKTPDYLCQVMDEINYFLKNNYGEEAYRGDITEAITEIIGNAIEHGQSECIVDIDVAPDYKKKNQTGNYYGVNIVVLNYSSILLGDALKNKLLNGTMELKERDYKALDAYNYHKKFFDRRYREEDFFNIASFQHKLSGRNNKYTGGTGLTKVILSLEKRSDAHNCYVTSGDRRLMFVHKCLEFDQEGWIGFNRTQNFFTALPQSGIIQNSDIYIPGTAFNLNFVMKKED